MTADPAKFKRPSWQSLRAHPGGMLCGTSLVVRAAMLTWQVRAMRPLSTSLTLMKTFRIRLETLRT
jgi:hypothetical protein